MSKKSESEVVGMSKFLMILLFSAAGVAASFSFDASRLKNVDGQRQHIDKTQEYQCLRGKSTKTFQTAKCP